MSILIYIILLLILVIQLILWLKLINIRNDIKQIRSWSHQGWENWGCLGRLLLKYKLLPPKSSNDQKWNWGDGR